MNSHLAIKINGQDMALKPDQTLDLEFQNPLFNDVDMFSLPFNPPFALNRKLLGNMDHPDSQLRATDMERQQAVVYGDGVPVTSGVTIVEDNSEMSEGLSMNIDASTRSFDDLIGDLECRDVPLKDRIQIGEKIGHVHIGVSYVYKITVKYEGKKGDKEYRWDSDKAEGDIEPQALGFSYPGICAVTGSKQVAIAKTTKYYPKGHQVKVPREANGYANSTFINVTDAYGENSDHWGPGGAKYCNARVCYKHYALNDDGTTSSEVVRARDYNNTIGEAMYEDHFPYWVLDADRPQSGICFYVLYFLDCLFAHLGVEFDKSALMAVEDLRHFCFFTTHCRYDIEPIEDASHTFQNLQQVNAWLESRGCGGQLKYEQPETKSIQEFTYKKNDGTPQTIKVGVDEVASITTEVISSSIYSFSAKVCKMWANSDNFPEESVKTILDSLQASFGIRFHYDYEKNKVTAYLLRDVFRQRDADGTPLSTMQFNGTVNSVTKLTDKITGFRMKYSAEGTAKEQEQYIRRGKRDYDTDFDYREYPEGRTIIDKTFEDIVGTIASTNMNVYVDKRTGNAYRIKINSEATNTADMRPVLFEVGQFKGIEVGDCSQEAEEDDMIREYVSDFQPISFNDINYSTRLGASDKEYKYVDGSDTYIFKKIVTGDQPILCAYIDEDMEHEFVEQRINNPLTAVLVDMYLAEVLTLVESYDPTKTDDGNSPLQTYEWGLAVAMMRGGGTNMTVQNYDHNYDGFGNDRWRTVAGEYALTSDTMDQMGNEFDYNGAGSGIGDGERFSLKIAAYKPFRYKYVSGQLKISTNPREWADPSWLVPCNDDVTDPVTHEIETKIRTRGLYNTFMAELCYFLLNRRPVRIKATTTVAQLADIPNHWRQLWQIGNMVGFINKVKFQLSVERSLGEVTIDFYVI